MKYDTDIFIIRKTIDNGFTDVPLTFISHADGSAFRFINDDDQLKLSNDKELTPNPKLYYRVDPDDEKFYSSTSGNPSKAGWQEYQLTDNIDNRDIIVLNNGQKLQIWNSGSKFDNGSLGYWGDSPFKLSRKI